MLGVAAQIGTAQMWLQTKPKGPPHIPVFTIHRMLPSSSHGSFPKFPGLSAYLEFAGIKEGRRVMLTFWGEPD